MVTTEEYLHKQIKKSSGRFEDIFMQAIPREVPNPHRQWSIGTTTETSVCKSLPSQSWGGKVWEIDAAQDITDKGKITQYRYSKQHTSQVQQAYPVKIMKWLGLDQVRSSITHIYLALTHEQIKRISPYLHLSYAYLEGKDISKQQM